MSMEYVQWISALGHSQEMPRGTFRINYRADPEYLWYPEPTAGFTNSLGFRGPEWAREKPAGVSRVVCLGDSCTATGEIPYAERLQSCLNAAGQRFDVMNAGVGSWSSYQGRLLLGKKILDFKPDVVTIYFGWNDHWLAWSHSDRDLGKYLSGRARWINLVRKSRLAQALTWAANRLLPRPDPRLRQPPLFRVSEEDYRKNLEAMVSSARTAGALPILLTAPTTLHAEHGVTRYLVTQSRLFHNTQQINQVHDAYNNVVRNVAAATETPLIDLAQEFIYIEDKNDYISDGIHLTPRGAEWVAQQICLAIRDRSRD